MMTTTIKKCVLASMFDATWKINKRKSGQHNTLFFDALVAPT